LPSSHIRKRVRESALNAAATGGGGLTPMAPGFFILLQLTLASAQTASVQFVNSDPHGH
jgi:hypothetical protein